MAEMFSPNLILEKKLSSELSLKEISLKRVTALLWRQADIIDSVDKVGIEHDVEKNLRKLILPPNMLEKVKCMLEPIGAEIRNWKNFHEKYLDIIITNTSSFFEHFHWTVLGKVNYQKTAENLIRHEMFDPVKLYILACVYCLEEYIPALYEMLSQECKHYFSSPRSAFPQTAVELEFCWPYFLKNEEPSMDRFYSRVTDNFNQYAFDDLLGKGNKAAAEYFLRKLPANVRQSSLVKAVSSALTRRSTAVGYIDYIKERTHFPKDKISEIVFDWLPLLTHEQQMACFREDVESVFVSISDWPYQDLFLEFADFIFDLLNDLEYYNLLKLISAKMKHSSYWASLFRDVFLRGSTNSIKEFANDESFFGIVLKSIFEARDVETIKVIFGKLDHEDRQRLLRSKVIFRIFCKSILRGDCNLVEPCFHTVSISKEDVDRLKETYFEFLSKWYSLDDLSKEHVSNTLHHLLHKTRPMVCNKRKTYEEDATDVGMAYKIQRSNLIEIDILQLQILRRFLNTQ